MSAKEAIRTELEELQAMFRSGTVGYVRAETALNLLDMFPSSISATKPSRKAKQAVEAEAVT